MGYIFYLKKLNHACSLASKSTKKSVLYHYADYVMSYILHGCSITQYYSGCFYKYRNFERSQIITFKRSQKIWKLFNDDKYVHYLENKADFNKYFSKYLKRDWVYSKDDIKNIYSFIARNDIFMYKPIDLLQGKGIKKINKSEINIEDFVEEIRSKEIILEEFIKQKAEMNFNNKSVNTIRVNSVIDKNGKVVILKAILRVGKGDSCVDNFCNGGVIYPIDINHGIVEGRGVDRNGDTFICHPNTNVCMLGYKIPSWDLVISTVKAISSAIPQCRYVGWDIAITENGVEVIEGNHNPDHELLENIGFERLFYKKVMNLL